MPAMLRRPFLGLTALVILVAPVAHAQGLPDPRTGIAYPTAQGAAVEDATSLMVNPAGLGNMEGFEVNLGGFVRSDGTSAQNDVDGTLVFTPMDAFGFALGSGMTLADGKSPRLRLSGGLGVGDRTFSTGVAVHSITALAGGGQPDWLVDIGAQARPARWMAVGLSLDGLGAQDTGPASARAGISLRPVQELLTVGLDVRLVPGSRDPSSPRFAEELTVVPGLGVRVDLGGFALTGGAFIANLGPVVSTPATVEVMGGIELNGGHIGLWAAGGADGVGGPAQRGLGAVRMRTSSAKWTPILPDSGRWLSLALTGEGVLVDNADRSLVAQLFASQPQAVAILAALDNAAQDEGIEGVVLRIKGLSLGWGRLAELRTSIKALRDAGKKVVVHLDGGSDAEVFVASAADKIYLTPSGNLELNGLRAEMLYFADTLDKIGLEAEAVSAGKYKSAPRTFTATEPSPEEIEVENALLDEAYNALVEMVAEGRGLDKETLKAVIDKGGLTAQMALDAKIIDGLAYEDELDDKVEELAERRVPLDDDFIDRVHRNVRWDAPPRIALIPVTGTIAMGGGGGLFSDGAGAEDTIEAIEQAARDDDVKAIVLRIDSPGGDALASDLIWRAVMKARDKKPVVASLGDVAASGGYYVAAAAHTIMAERNTITGSIGVFGLLFNGERLLDDVGVRVHSMERGALPGPSALRPLSEAERAALQVSVDATYERFLTAIVEGRGATMGLDKEGVRAIAEGRVWTGAQAKERKLVDAMGGVLDALEEARKRAEIPEDEDIVLDVITGTDNDLVRLAGLASSIVGANAGSANIAKAVRWLLGDPNALAFALEHEGKPMAVAPVNVRVR
jgi:protease-4